MVSFSEVHLIPFEAYCSLHIGREERVEMQAGEYRSSIGPIDPEKAKGML